MWGDDGLNQRTSRGGGYGRETGIIDLGHEPPLSVDGSEAAVIDRRRVSVQWFSGTILTGLCGAALIGGAVFTSLDGEMTFAKVPERVEGALRGAFGVNDRSASLHKSDRLPPPGESTAARNVVRVSTVSRVGNRDVMRVRPYIRISGNLSMTTSDLSAKIPPFNAQRMLSDVGSAVAAASDDPNNADAVEPDAEVSFVTKDLAPILPSFERLGVRVELDGTTLRVPPGQELVVKDDLGGQIPKIEDGPWPAFPADLTSIALAVATQAQGTVLIFEKMFENRLFFVDKLVSMGARIILCDPHRAVVTGPARLFGQRMASPDIRAGMAMLIASLCAEGTSTIGNVGEIDRGYERIDERLRSLGARIERVEG